jgi:NAD-dependent dihydropyrimidine dehydrogenase PreA subunit
MNNKYLKNVATLELTAEKCTGCGMCVNVCPHNVFELDEDMSKVRIVDRDSCMECSACMQNCPFSAIKVQTGVGCAAAVIRGLLTGKEPNCGCSEDDCCN